MINTNYSHEVTSLSRKSLAILKAVKNQWQHFHGKHLYRIQITVPLPPESLIIPLNTLSGVMRQLCNGSVTIDGATNRNFFNNHFAGGFYSMSVINCHDTGYSVHYRLRLISKSAKPQVELGRKLEKRVHRIVPSATVRLQGSTKLDSISDFENEIESLESETRGDTLKFQSIPTSNHHLLRWILQTVASEIRTFGNLYKTVHLC